MKISRRIKGYKQGWLIFALVFAAVGITLLIITKAATPSFSIEPENSQVSGNAAQVNDATASGGKATKFGDAVVTPPGGDTVVIAAAGDIGGSWSADKTIGDLIKNDPSIQAVLAPGDLAYPNGTDTEFKYYDETWGSFKSKTYPAIGNHEYFHKPATGKQIGYRNYWSNNAEFGWANTPKPPAPVADSIASRYYYTFNLGNWQLFALDSEKDIPTQTTWLDSELKKNPKTCTLAFWHSPYWAGSSPSGKDADDKPISAGTSTGRVKPLVDALVAAKADIIIAGHEHAYVSFPKLSPSTNKADANGIRTWVSGAGGTSPTSSGLMNNYAGVVYLDNSSNVGATGTGGIKGGYLKMELKPTSYTWQYIDTTGAVRHSGSDTCRP